MFHTDYASFYVSEKKETPSDGTSPGSEWISDWLNKSEAGNSPVGWTPSYESKEDQAAEIRVCSK